MRLSLVLVFQMITDYGKTKRTCPNPNPATLVAPSKPRRNTSIIIIILSGGPYYFIGVAHIEDFKEIRDIETRARSELSCCCCTIKSNPTHQEIKAATLQNISSFNAMHELA